MVLSDSLWSDYKLILEPFTFLPAKKESTMKQHCSRCSHFCTVEVSLSDIARLWTRGCLDTPSIWKDQSLQVLYSLLRSLVKLHVTHEGSTLVTLWSGDDGKSWQPKPRAEISQQWAILAQELCMQLLILDYTVAALDSYQVLGHVRLKSFHAYFQ